MYFQNTIVSIDAAKFLVAVFDTNNNSTIVKDLGQIETTEQYYKEYQFGFLGMSHVIIIDHRLIVNPIQ